MTFGLVYLGVFVILIWAFLLSSNLGAGYRYKFRAVSAPENAHGSSVTPMTSVTVGSKTSLSSRFQSQAKIVCSKAGHFWP